MMEASRPYHHKFTRAASRDRPPMIVKYYNHSYTLLPETYLSCTVRYSATLRFSCFVSKNLLIAERTLGPEEM